ncbi:hypothetical protein GCM10009579_00040 [Streptomyces javensis]|uniref:Uncharacterized protein n=1 Tax=Streptomyces javensis TaxID=114698 RepID=A0ABP4H140_9ACTN
MTWNGGLLSPRFESDQLPPEVIERVLAAELVNQERDRRGLVCPATAKAPAECRAEPPRGHGATGVLVTRGRTRVMTRGDLSAAAVST